MANIQYFPGNATVALPQSTFDITAITAKRVGPYLNYYSANTDGTMFVIHTTASLDASGAIVQNIVGWDHFSGSDLLQSATVNLPAKPFLDNLNSRAPNSLKAFNYLMGGNDAMTGSDVADRMSGLNGNDTMSGGAGNDLMRGGNGNDTLDGGEGNDNLFGDAGDDHLFGGLGKDKMTGGAGADQFHFDGLNQGTDTVLDFTHGTDHLAMSTTGFALHGPLVDGVNMINGTSALLAEASFIYDAVTGNLSYDADGTGAAAAQVIATLSNHSALTAGDILIA